MPCRRAEDQSKLCRRSRSQLLREVLDHPLQVAGLLLVASLRLRSRNDGGQLKKEFGPLQPGECQQQAPVALRHFDGVFERVLGIMEDQLGTLAPDSALRFVQPVLGNRITHQLVTVLPFATSTSASMSGCSWSVSISSKIVMNSGASPTGSMPARMFLKINEPTISSRFLSLAYSARVI